MSEHYDLIENLKSHAAVFRSSGKAASESTIMEAVETIELYEAMKEGFTARATDYEKRVGELEALLREIDDSIMVDQSTEGKFWKKKIRQLL